MTSLVSRGSFLFIIIFLHGHQPVSVCHGAAYQNFPHVTVTAVHPGHVGTDIARLVGDGGGGVGEWGEGDGDNVMTTVHSLRLS